MNRAADGRELIIGGEPRADLLPPDLRARRKGRALHRALVIGMGGIVVIMAAAIGLVSLQAALHQNDLAAAKLRTDEILTETTKYAEVSRVQDQYATTLVVRALGLSTEVDWTTYLAEIRAILPADVTVDSVKVSTGSPWLAYEQSAVPLAQPRAASIALELTSPELPTVPEWLVGLKTLPGYAGSSPGSFTRSDSGSYAVSLTVNVNESALSHRFATEE